MPDEDIGLDALVQPPRGQVIAHVGIADPRRHADGARGRGKQRRFADAEAAAVSEHPARLEVRRIGEVDVGVVDNVIADRAIEPQDLVFLFVGPGGHRIGEHLDRGHVAVDEAGGGKQIVHTLGVHCYRCLIWKIDGSGLGQLHSPCVTSLAAVSAAMRRNSTRRSLPVSVRGRPATYSIARGYL